MIQLPFPRLRALIAGLALAAPLAACGVDRVVKNDSISEDYAKTHPIVLTHAPKTLDIFPTGGGLDRPSAARVREFAEAYKMRGEGQITILQPTGGAEHGSALAAIRHELVAGGAKGYASVGSYPVADPSLAAPIRLSFTQLKARTATTCGQWPADLASGDTVQGWANRPYYNSGCAYQSMLAAQVDDPRDLANPRAETPADTAMRSRAIGNVRKGTDPGTSWKTTNSNIGTVGN